MKNLSDLHKILGLRFTLDKKPIVVCELRPHAQGHFDINRKSYHPEWPRGVSVRITEPGLLEIIGLGLEEAKNIYKENNKSPSSIRIEIYDNKTRIITRD